MVNKVEHLDNFRRVPFRHFRQTFHSDNSDIPLGHFRHLFCNVYILILCCVNNVLHFNPLLCKQHLCRHQRGLAYLWDRSDECLYTTLVSILINSSQMPRSDVNAFVDVAVVYNTDPFVAA